MKDSEFIELLNLYLDHEISAADAARLEAEVQANPARRQIYRNYCQMQKACKMVAQDFVTEPAEVAEKVVPFQPAAASRRAAQGGGFYTIGALVAAAACVAIVLVGRSRQQPAENATQNQVAATTLAPQPAKAEPLAIDTPRAQARATNPIRRNPDVTFVSGNTLLLSSSQQPTANDPFGWLGKDLNLVSQDQQLAADQLRFQNTPTSLRPESGQKLGKAALKQQEPAKEMVIFQFQR